VGLTGSPTTRGHPTKAAAGHARCRSPGIRVANVETSGLSDEERQTMCRSSRRRKHRSGCECRGDAPNGATLLFHQRDQHFLDRVEVCVHSGRSRGGIVELNGSQNVAVLIEELLGLAAALSYPTFELAPRILTH
jgi:hypothetical protein